MEIFFVTRLARTIFKFHDVAPRAAGLLHRPARPGAADGVLGEHDVAGVVDAFPAPVRTRFGPLLRGPLPRCGSGGMVGGVEGSV